MVNGLDEIPIDRTEIPQEQLDLTDKTRSSAFAWKGQFSPQFIELMLRSYAPGDGAVFDPFLGSGTVLHESAARGLAASGMELNPSAYFMAKAYELANLPPEDRSPLLSSLDQTIIDSCRSGDPALSMVERIDGLDEGPARNLLSLVVVLMDLGRKREPRSTALRQWGKVRETVSGLPFSPKPVSAFLGDSRRSPVADGEVDLVITSPPFLNVFNYHQNYRKSVELLGYDVLKIARQEFGSNRKNRGNRLLTLIQYCMDISLVFKELVRICRPGARIVVVIGKESNIMSCPFSNSGLIYRIATGIFSLGIPLRQQRSFMNKFGQVIVEDILHFTGPGPSCALTQAGIIAKATDIARDALVAGLASKTENRADFLYAIGHADSIRPS
jgi:hypothetical protein